MLGTSQHNHILRLVKDSQNTFRIVPIIKYKKVTGFQLYIGGGLGQKNGKITFALLGVPLGSVKNEKELILVIEGIINEWSLLGDRKNRHWARLKNVLLKKGQIIENISTEEMKPSENWNRPIRTCLELTTSSVNWINKNDL